MLINYPRHGNPSLENRIKSLRVGTRDAGECSPQISLKSQQREPMFAKNTKVEKVDVLIKVRNNLDDEVR